MSTPSVSRRPARQSAAAPAPVVQLPTPVAAEPKVPFELPVSIEKLAELFGWTFEWIHEKCRKDPVRNPNPLPHHKPGKYLMFYPSEVNDWIKAS